MYGKADPQQQWSVHAEFTISHPRVGDPENVPQTHTEQGDNGVRMTYTWTSQSNQNAWSSRSTPPPSGSTTSNRSTHSDTSKSYGFQRGNLLFTTTPPRRPYNFTESNTNNTHRLGGGVQDSGYGSDLLSPNSFGSSLLPRRQVQPYNRKCRSTCNIVLSTNVQDENRTEDKADSIHTQCGRTQSLRCQTPTLRSDRKDSFYGCGDPWCHHIRYGDEFSCGGRFSPVPETCEDCPSGHASSTKASRTNTKESDNRKDACVQTFEMIDKCTSPFVKMGSFKYNEEEKRERMAAKKKYAPGGRRKTEPISQRSHSPSSITPDSLESLKGSRRIVRSPKVGKLTSGDAAAREKHSSAESKQSDASKKPRTVHIDVYCTGTDMESDGSNSSSESSENETASTPQTVFESEKLRITHKRADETELPYNVRKSRSRSRDRKPEAKQEQESDNDNDDGASTAYPSKLSSYSTIRDFSSSISSVPQSWTPFSMSSCTVPDDFDSIANTSWKDTFSDIDSLLHSRSSIAQTDSLDFVPRRFFEKNQSIDETPEIEIQDVSVTPSHESIQPSDSFEYANSEDRLRIKKMEEFWKNKAHTKQWRAPHLERRYLLQQKKIKEYLEKRLSDKNLPKWQSKESDSEGSDESEKGWTFMKAEDKRRGQMKTDPTGAGPSGQQSDIKSLTNSSSSNKSPSTIFIQQRLSMDSSLRAPFTIVPGIYTDQRAIAKKFGSIIPVVRKPGHHIGPVKNPDCLCDHCQRHFMNSSCRGRTRSMGDTPIYPLQNWKDIPRYPMAESISNKSVPSQLFTNF